MKTTEKNNILQFVVFNSFINAQNIVSDSTEYAHFDCGIMQTKQKLDKNFFASTPAIELRVNNEEFHLYDVSVGEKKE